jgi:peptidoglycan/LPS O-acetylase OafA/YrhL
VAAWFSRLLVVGPLSWIGRRSYSIRLWHWPVVVVTRPGLDVHGSTALITIARIALILWLAGASYRFVEMPWRTRGARRGPIESSAARTSRRSGLLVGAVAGRWRATLWSRKAPGRLRRCPSRMACRPRRWR